MKIFPILLLISFAFVLSFQQMKGVQFNSFEPRRPIKYFFHLLELKATFNPLFYPIYNNPKTCSSKSGPFCSFAGHKSLDSYELRTPSPQMQVIRKQLQAAASGSYQLLQSIEKKETSLFLIRNALTNHYETVLRKSMGDLNKEEMLDEKIFKKKDQL